MDTITSFFTGNAALYKNFIAVSDCNHMPSAGAPDLCSASYSDGGILVAGKRQAVQVASYIISPQHNSLTRHCT